MNYKPKVIRQTPLKNGINLNYSKALKFILRRQKVHVFNNKINFTFLIVQKPIPFNEMTKEQRRKRIKHLWFKVRLAVRFMKS